MQENFARRCRQTRHFAEKRRRRFCAGGVVDWTGMLPQRFRLRRLRGVWEGGGGEEQERAGDVEGSGPAAAGLGQDVSALGQLAELQAAVRIADGRTDDGPRGIRQRKFRAGQRRLGRAVHLFHAEAREAHPGPDRVGFLDRGGLHGPEAEGIDGLQPRDRAAGLILIDLRAQESHGVFVKGLRRAYRDPDLES